MSDPLGLIGAQHGITQPLPGAGGQTGRTPAGGLPLDPNAPSFKDVLLENINQVNKLQQDATAATEDLLAGRRDDVEGVLIATQKADTAFRMLLQVRNKVMDAYEEIKQIRV
ncbi:MAG: flagellar hook-basal body complex protein FliE [Phycisphaerales bacterium]|nr:MAG: flagellar hook-basal body complex protein FliE [Phycisphaerales bacterium]